MSTATDKAALQQFAHDLQQDVVTEASIEGRESMLSEAFTTMILETLSEIGEVVEPHTCYHRQRGIEVSGWGWDDLDGTLDLVITVFKGGGTPTIPKRDVETAFKRVDGFFTAALEGLFKDLEEASGQWDLAYFIYQNQKVIERVHLHLITDGVTRADPPEESETAGFPVSFHLWDIARINRVFTSGAKRDPIEIDLVERFGSPLPALPAPTESSDFESYLLVIPGTVLADLYGEYGSRLLELNVRSFLQARGKVNKGIRNTIIEEPERFFAYNNGISATASRVDATTADDGTAQLTRLVDLQIVNGGQTTASIATTAAKDGAPLDRVFVQAKLTVVPEERIDDLVPLISRFANSQNKVSEADLSANHKFHVTMEELSRTIWAPAPEGGSRETRWFYERARGQYNDALSNERTPAKKRAFKEIHPSRQKFTKTDLAKFENTWIQKPHIVSRGAQKNFVDFMLSLDKSSSNPTEEYFKRVCALGIMFRETERIVGKQNFGAYRANIVTYTLALLANRTSMRIDLDQIWQRQTMGAELVETIEHLSEPVFNHIAYPPGAQNVTEWCKKEKCWTELRDSDITIDGELTTSLLAKGSKVTKGPRRVGPVDAPDAEQQADIDWVSAIPADHWFAVSSWAKETDQLQPWQRGLSFSIAKLVRDERPPSIKQAKQGRILYEKAVELGFRMDDA